MRSRPLVALALVTVSAVLAGCRTGETTGGDASAAPTTEAPMSEDTSDDTSDLGPALSRVVEQAVEDLARRLDVPEGDIAVVSAEEVSWGDTSLGCPQPGMRYAQVVTDGVKVVLEHDGQPFPYHAGGTRTDPFLCEQPPDKETTSPSLAPR